MSARRRKRRGRPVRSARARGGSASSSRRWIGATVVLLVIAVAMFATGLGGYLAENFIAPLYERIASDGLAGLLGGGSATPKPSASMGQATASPTASPGERAEITVPGAQLYAVQLGSFSARESAESESSTVQARGGAGYILQDGTRYRVLASAYRNEDDARSVRENLKSVQQIDSYVFVATMPDTVWTITASPERKKQIEEAFAAWEDMIDGLIALSEEHDRSALSGDQIKSRLEAMVQAITPHVGHIASMLSAAGEHRQLDALHEVLSNVLSDLGELASESNASAVAIASKIKYNVIDMVVTYQQKLISP